MQYTVVSTEYVFYILPVLIFVRILCDYFMRILCCKKIDTITISIIIIGYFLEYVFEILYVLYLI